MQNYEKNSLALKEELTQQQYRYKKKLNKLSFNLFAPKNKKINKCKNSLTLKKRACLATEEKICIFKKYII